MATELRPSNSSWSIATTKVESECLSPLNTPLRSNTPSIPACWRLGDVTQINQAEDRDSISRLLWFRPFTDDFELKLYIIAWDRASKTPYSPWTWKPYEFHDFSAEDIAEAFARVSMEKFSEIPFEDWVRHALGLAPVSVENLEHGYIKLGCRLFYYLRRNSAQETKYQRVVELLRTADPFIHGAIENACRCLPERAYRDVSPNFNCIIQPLQQLLNEPSPTQYLLQQLEVLAVRYKLRFLSPEVDWSHDFEICTDCFRWICGPKIWDLALELCKNNLTHFQKLHIHRWLVKDNHLAPLNSRWNNLCRMVQECAGVDDQADRNLMDLVEALSSLRNFFSLTAVIQGLSLGKYHSPALERFLPLVNASNNYENYRRILFSGPALHFLFPLIKCSTNGELLPLLVALWASRLYKPQYGQILSLVLQWFPSFTCN